MSLTNVLSQQTLFQNFSEEDNLVSNQIYDLFQDNMNKLWIASDMGVICYDGIDFENIVPNSDEQLEPILQFFPQESGELWACTMNKIYIVNVKERKISSFKFNDLLARTSKNLSIEDVQINERGETLISYRLGNGICIISKEGKLLSSPSFESNSYPSVFIDRLDNGKIFHYKSTRASSRFEQSLFKVDSTAGNLTNFKLSTFQEKTLIVTWGKIYLLDNWDMISEISSNRKAIRGGFITNNEFWVGYQGGGFEVFDFNGNLISKHLPGTSVTNILIDRENNIWVSTLNSGLYRTTSLHTKHLDFQEYSSVNSVSQGPEQSIQFVTSNGELIKLNSGNRTLYQIDNLLFAGVFNNKEYTVSDESIFTFNSIQHDLGGFVRKVSENNSKPLLFTGNYSITKYANDQFIEYKTSGYNTDASFFKGELYVGKKDGLYVYNTKEFEENKVHISGLNSSIVDIDNGNSYMVIGTRGSGVFVHSNTYLNLTDKEGLSSNYINEVLIQNDSIFWVCTPTGLDRVLYINNKIISVQSLNRSNGLASNHILDLEIIRDTLWVVTAKGIGIIPEAEFTFANKQISYPILLKGVEVNGEKNFRPSYLSYSQNNIHLYFETVSLKGNSKITYRYKIKESSKQWDYIENGSITLKSLSPGEYNVTIEAFVNGVKQKDTLSYSFIIYPPFYKSWWFITCVILVLLFTIYLFFKYRILSYNRDVIRAILRRILKLLNKGTMTFVIRQQGENITVNSQQVLYVKSLGNYIQIKTINEQYVIRHKISEFTDLVPDPLEYVQVRKSHIVRIDKIDKYSSKTVTINNEEIAIGRVFKINVEEVMIR